MIHTLAYSGLGLTEDSTPDQIYTALAAKFQPYINILDWTASDFTVTHPGNFSVDSNELRLWKPTSAGSNNNNFAKSKAFSVSEMSVMYITYVYSCSVSNSMADNYIKLVGADTGTVYARYQGTYATNGVTQTQSFDISDIDEDVYVTMTACNTLGSYAATLIVTNWRFE